MAMLSFLSLLDDIATVLDDVAVLSKMAAKKTAGVLSDDLAVNAEKVAGVAAEREIPVIWEVTKGSLKNKAILTPIALLLTAIAPWLIPFLLMLGGSYLCFEGAEKVISVLFTKKETLSNREKIEQIEDKVANQESISLFEKKKIQGAIRTDFILSAEIIIIALSTVQGIDFKTQVVVVSLVVLVLTLGTYGLVAAIIKLDDLGLYLIGKDNSSEFNKSIGYFLLQLAPKIMRFLAIAGTIAMFLVGGSIMQHNLHYLQQLFSPIQHILTIELAQTLLNTTVTIVIGTVWGLILVGLLTIYKTLHRVIHN